MEIQKSFRSSLHATMSTMVIQAIELELKKYIDDILKVGNETFDSKLKQEYSNTEEKYFINLLEISYKISNNEDHKKSLNNLIKLTHDYGIGLIRNHAHHGNRPFNKNQWFKLAAFATDENMIKLNFQSVAEQVIKAEKGDLNYDVKLDELPNYEVFNNLPLGEFSTTGFLGRKKEKEELMKAINTPRTNNIAILGVGGSGKTALATKALEELKYNSNLFDCILFYEFKTESITADKGLFKKQINFEFENIKQKLVEDLVDFGFEPSTDHREVSLLNFSETKLCLCLDNMENIVLETPDLLEDFINGLPPSWKLIITSRIKVENTKIIELGYLSNQDAKNLIHLYGKSLDSNFTDNYRNQIPTILEKCGSNPLMLRVAIDLLMQTNDFPGSINNAVEMVSNYSFKTIGENLEDTAIDILEYLRQRGKSSESIISDNLGLSREKIRDYLFNIKKTSLLKQEIDEDGEPYYEITFMTDSFLVSSERAMPFREKNRNIIRLGSSKENERETFNSKLKEFDKENPFIIPEDVSTGFIDVLKFIQFYCRGRLTERHIKNVSYQKIQKAKEKLENLPRSNNHWFYKLCQGLIYHLLSVSDAEIFYLDSLESAPEHEKNKLKEVLANYFFLKREYKKANEYYSELYTYNKEKYFEGMYLSIVFQDDLDKTTELYKFLDGELVSNPELERVAGSLKVNIIKRLWERDRQKKDGISLNKKHLELFKILEKMKLNPKTYKVSPGFWQSLHKIHKDLYSNYIAFISNYDPVKKILELSIDLLLDSSNLEKMGWALPPVYTMRSTIKEVCESYLDDEILSNDDKNCFKKLITKIEKIEISGHSIKITEFIETQLAKGIFKKANVLRVINQHNILFAELEKTNEEIFCHFSTFQSHPSTKLSLVPDAVIAIEIEEIHIKDDKIPDQKRRSKNFWILDTPQ